MRYVTICNDVCRTVCELIIVGVFPLFRIERDDGDI
jgi:hypothetical protein